MSLTIYIYMKLIYIFSLSNNNKITTSMKMYILLCIFICFAKGLPSPIFYDASKSIGNPAYDIVCNGNSKGLNFQDEEPKN